MPYFYFVTRNDWNSYYIDANGRYTEYFSRAAIYTKENLPDPKQIIALNGNHPEVYELSDKELERLTA